jgi:hypothetical protein
LYISLYPLPLASALACPTPMRHMRAVSGTYNLGRACQKGLEP